MQTLLPKDASRLPWQFVPIAFIGLAAALLTFGCNPTSSAIQGPKVTSEKREIRLASREDRLENHPCTQCHEHVTAENRRGIRPSVHRNIRMQHFGAHDQAGEVENTRCLQCHSLKNMNMLQLLDGTEISFNESQKVCAQCHFDKARDWAVGMHSKQIGDWNGDVEYRLMCVECHDSHAPSNMLVMKPQPPPPRPRLGLKKTPHGKHGSHDAKDATAGGHHENH
ncbi:MAG: hypothetical protein GY822_16230 [Deltaproteobacteria bacterium]|nr:hypothetical protein [Deltaproteobacteria bacterium]